MRGILIDPWFGKISMVEVKPGIDGIYCQLSNPAGPDVTCFTSGFTWKNGDTLYVDDEGLLKGGMFIFKIFDQTLAGNGLIIGSDSEGRSTDVKHSLGYIQSQVKWTNLVTT